MCTMGEKCQFLEDTGATFDYAFPGGWGHDVEKLTGFWPRGIVWLYDKPARFFGRPYAVTFEGWIILKMYEHTKKHSGGG